MIITYINIKTERLALNSPLLFELQQMLHIRQSFPWRVVAPWPGLQNKHRLCDYTCPHLSELTAHIWTMIR